MSEKEYYLSEAVLDEELADLAFKKVMARYCEIESEKILEEMKSHEEVDKEQESVDVSKVDKLFSSIERKNNIRSVFSASRKIFAAVASIILVCAISVSSVIIASAEARDYVFELVFTEMEKYTDIQIVKKEPSEESLFSEMEYIPTYVPFGFTLDKNLSFVQKNNVTLRYAKDDSIIIFEYCDADSYDEIQIDTENAYESKNIEINGKTAIVYYKEYSCNGLKYIIWQSNDSVFVVYSNTEPDVLIKFAEGISENEGK